MSQAMREFNNAKRRASASEQSDSRLSTSPTSTTPSVPPTTGHQKKRQMTWPVSSDEVKTSKQKRQSSPTGDPPTHPVGAAGTITVATTTSSAPLVATSTTAGRSSASDLNLDHRGPNSLLAGSTSRRRRARDIQTSKELELFPPRTNHGEPSHKSAGPPSSAKSPTDADQRDSP